MERLLDHRFFVFSSNLPILIFLQMLLELLLIHSQGFSGSRIACSGHKALRNRLRFLVCVRRVVCVVISGIAAKD